MSYLQNGSLIITAIGVTVGVIGAAGMLLYQQFLEKQQYKTQNRNLQIVNQRIHDLQAELDALRQQQNRLKKRKGRSAKKKYELSPDESTYFSTDTDTYSTAATDFDDDDFYDCFDSEGAADDVESSESGPASELEVELMKIDAQEEVEDESKEDTYYKLHTLTKFHPRNVGVIWRFARACYNYMNISSDIEYKRELIDEGIKACKEMIDIKDADLHKWYAILIGLNAQYLPVTEKIQSGYEFKKHILIALEIRPKDSDLYYLLGRFKYDVSNLSWLERKVAATLFTEPPYATFEDAIESFEQAEQFATKPNLQNRLFLSKAYIAIRNYDKAVNLLNDICKCSLITKTNQDVQSEANKLLEYYSSYL